MDPDKALEEIRAEIKSAHERPHGLDDTARLTRLVELVEGLDEWLASGGFKPKHWSHRGGGLPPGVKDVIAQQRKALGLSK